MEYEKHSRWLRDGFVHVLTSTSEQSDGRDNWSVSHVTLTSRSGSSKTVSVDVLKREWLRLSGPLPISEGDRVRTATGLHTVTAVDAFRQTCYRLEDENWYAPDDVTHVEDGRPDISDWAEHAELPLGKQWALLNPTADGYTLEVHGVASPERRTYFAPEDGIQRIALPAVRCRDCGLDRVWIEFRDEVAWTVCGQCGREEQGR